MFQDDTLYKLTYLLTYKGAIFTGQTKRVCGSVQVGSVWFTLVACAVKITTFHFGSIWRLLT